MKKFIILLLVLTLTFSLFAGCKKKKKPTSESTPPTSESTPTEQIPAGSTTSSNLASALSAQFSDVSSLTIEISVDSYSESESHYYNDDGEGNKVAESDYDIDDTTSSVIIDLSIDDSDKLNAKFKTVFTDRVSQEENVDEAYIIEDVMYTWNESAKAWVVASDET